MDMERCSGPATEDSVLTALHSAAINKDLYLLRDVLDNVPDKCDAVNKKAARGVTVLHLATWSPEAVELLCAAGADPQIPDELGNTALHCVADGHGSSCQVVDILVRYGAVVDARNARRKTPLHQACIQLRLPVIKQLLQHDADSNARDAFGATALHYVALYQPMSDTFGEELARESKSDSNTRLERYRRTRLAQLTAREILILANRREHVGGYGNIADDEDKIDYVISRLYLFEMSEIRLTPDLDDHVEAVSVLVKSRAEVNVADNFGRTPIHIASILGYRSVALCLIENGADVHARNAHGATALHQAARNGLVDIVSLLMDAHHSRNASTSTASKSETAENDTCNDVRQVPANDPAQETSPFSDYINWRDSYTGETALHKASRVADNYETVDVLIKLGASVNAADALGLRPLHAAVLSKSWQTTHLLMASGVDSNAQDLYGFTPLHYVVVQTDGDETERLKACKRMIELGGDCNVQARTTQQTPLHIASIHLTYKKSLSDLFMVLWTNTTLSLKDDLGNTCVNSAFANTSLLWQEYFADNYSGEENKCKLTPWLNHYNSAIDCWNIFKNSRSTGSTDVRVFANMPTLAKVYNAAGNDSFGRNLLHILCSRPGHVYLAFAATSGHVHTPDFLQRTFLHHMCVNRSITPDVHQLVSVISRSQDIINVQDSLGRTPLFYAALHCSDAAVIKMLLRMGASGHIADNDRILPGDVALSLPDIHGSMLPKSKDAGNVVFVTQDADHVSDDDQIDSAVRYLRADPLGAWRKLKQEHNDSEFCLLLKKSVTAFVNNVMARVASIDRRFASWPTLVGSSGENVASKPTQDEYDFLVALPMFEHEFDSTVDADHSTGAVRFRLSEDETSYKEFCNADSVLLPALVTRRLYTLLIEAISDPDVWSDGVFEYMLTKIKHTPNCPAIAVQLKLNRLWDGHCLYVLRRGRWSDNRFNFLLDDTGISVDFVPAIRTSHKLSSKTKLAEFISSTHDDLDTAFYAIMKSPKAASCAASSELCMMTMSIAESEIVRRSPEAVRAAYALIKSSLFRYFNFKQDINADSPSSVITKYALKTCVLHCITTNSFSGADEVELTSETLTTCIRAILRRLGEVAFDDVVPYVVDPKRSFPVWKFEPFPTFCKWLLWRLGFSYDVVVCQHFDECIRNDVTGRAVAESERSSAYSWLSADKTSAIMTMLNTFRLYSEFCRDFCNLTTDEYCRPQEPCAAEETPPVMSSSDMLGLHGHSPVALSAHLTGSRSREHAVLNKLLEKQGYCFTYPAIGWDTTRCIRLNEFDTQGVAW